MQLSWNGTRHIGAPPERIWRRLLDPRALTEGSRTVESVEELGPGHFRVTVAVGLGFFKLRAPIDVRHTDLIEPERGTLLATGEAMGTTVTARATFVLRLAGDGTDLDWTAEGEVTGKLAGLAGATLEETLHHLTDEFWDDFAGKVTAKG